MTTSTLLTQVPREIWEIILLNLPYYEDLVVASLTCNLWHNILADHLVCPAKCSVAAYGWKVDQPFVYNFLPGTPPSEKDEKLPLDRAVNHWVTWPHVPLCFEIVLRDRRERGPRFKSRAHYGLSVRWVFRGLIPYMEKDHRRMDIDPSQRLGVATGQSHTQHTPQGAGVGGALRDSGSLREPMAVEVVGHVEGQHTVVDGPRPDDDAHAERRDDDEGDDQDHTTAATTSAAQAEGAGSKGTGGVLMVDQQAAPVPAEQKGKSFMAGFYIPHMDKYAFGTDTLVFELHVQVGGAHIPGSPFLLAFFNPLLP
ncbi:Fbox domain containing protein [Acanthamoeba castellanii str. Neff]|uniref:Fbox domain containing protein n=1 Tax=Acanthamoeba castellanii (strain ATCC 30010 / Neff) TaxID=1257118 RepID=L8HML4_ACACF|nr:Fbox domain containing protein [Acanthamoeba castellanii str. Neff]ELR25611.1 Fbox domain containing protein [Acanthamoeba castellanii str. Neff]